MSSSFERYQKRRLISSYFSVVISISLVLFLLGILGILVLNTKKVADHFKEQIALTVFLKDTAKEVEIDQLEKTDIEEFRYYNYDEKFRPLVLLAGGLLLFEILLRYTLFRSFI